MSHRIFTFARALLLVSAAALVMLAAPRPAAAYTYSRTCWPTGTTLKWTSNSATMRFSSVSFPVGSYRNALQDAVNRWNENPSAFNFSTVYNDTSIDFNNGQSEVWFSSDVDYNPAMEFTEYTGMLLCINPSISESDVVFYVGEDYTASMDARDHWEHGDAANPSNATYRPFQTTAMHELGHSVGLGHEADEHNIMGRDWEHIHVNGDTARAYAGEDACDGAVDLYGASGVVEDFLGHHLGVRGPQRRVQRSPPCPVQGHVRQYPAVQQLRGVGAVPGLARRHDRGGVHRGEQRAEQPEHRRRD